MLQAPAVIPCGPAAARSAFPNRSGHSPRGKTQSRPDNNDAGEQTPITRRPANSNLDPTIANKPALNDNNADPSAPDDFSGFLKTAIQRAEETADAPVAGSKPALTKAPKGKDAPADPKAPEEAVLSVVAAIHPKETQPLVFAFALRSQTSKSKGDSENQSSSEDATPEKSSAVSQPTSQTMTEISPNKRGMSGLTLSPELAFSAMIQDRTAQSDHVAYVKNVTPAPVTPAPKKMAEPESHRDIEDPDVSPSDLKAIETASIPTETAPPQDGQPARDTAPAREISAVAASQPVDVIKDPAPSTNAVKDISFQVPSAIKGAAPVQIHVTAETGDVRVDVRSFNPEVTQSLRTHLNDLVSRLDQQGMHAAVSHAGTIAPSRESVGAGLDSKSSDSGSGNSNPRQGSQNQHHGQQDSAESEQQRSRNRAEQWANIMNAKSRNF